MNGHLPFILPLSSHLGLFFASHCIFIKSKVYLMNHNILPRFQAVLLVWKNRNTERKEVQGGFLFMFLWLMYCMAYMFTECTCLVMLTKWMTKRVLMCHLTVCLSITVYVFPFCPLKKTQLYSKAVWTQHSLPYSCQLSSELGISSQEPWGRTLQLCPEGLNWAWLGPSFCPSSNWTHLCSHLSLQNHTLTFLGQAT